MAKQVRLWATLFIGVLAATTPAPGQRQIPTPEQAKVEEAMRIGDPFLRRAALRIVVATGLLSAPSDDARRSLVDYLLEHRRWLDLGDIADILEQFIEALPHHHSYNDRVLDALDETELRKASREERAEYYVTAMEKGFVRLNRGRLLMCSEAVFGAAIEGMQELRPLILAHLGETIANEEEVLAMLELRAGGSGLDDSTHLAVTRLAAMSDEELWSRMEQRGFRDAVLSTVDYSCEQNYFTFETDPDCLALHAVSQRLARLFKRRVAESGGGPCYLTPLNVPRGTTDPTFAPTWLSQFVQRACPRGYCLELP